MRHSTGRTDRRRWESLPAPGPNIFQHITTQNATRWWPRPTLKTRPARRPGLDKTAQTTPVYLPTVEQRTIDPNVQPLHIIVSCPTTSALYVYPTLDVRTYGRTDRRTGNLPRFDQYYSANRTSNNSSWPYLLYRWSQQGNPECRERIISAAVHLFATNSSLETLIIIPGTLK